MGGGCPKKEICDCNSWLRNSWNLVRIPHEHVFEIESKEEKKPTPCSNCCFTKLKNPEAFRHKCHLEYHKSANSTHAKQKTTKNDIAPLLLVGITRVFTSRYTLSNSIFIVNTDCFASVKVFNLIRFLLWRCRCSGKTYTGVAVSQRYQQKRFQTFYVYFCYHVCSLAKLR